ncbi:hypothetical protein K7X08_013525 [Anisodus acutangulus]|uniref:Btz domain-containing protein n=1 Tax=Anisodus acutangulus TaxID=402998 RepID=A0A9Q1R281_9SOLA|nr:hypothetical protein K7X08_013525 [Anisodus acutangulus]
MITIPINPNSEYIIRAVSMEKKVEATSSTNKSPVVYLHGNGCDRRDVWYPIDVESLRLHSVIDTNKPKTECSKCYAMTIRPHPEPMQLSPIAKMRFSEQRGSWTIDVLLCSFANDDGKWREEYESDAEETKLSLKMRRREEASNDEEEKTEMPLRSSIDSDNESEGQGAPAVYEEEVEDEEEVEYEEELYEEGVKEVVERVDDGNEHNLEKKENEPYAVPKAGAFYMHDDRLETM